MTKTRFPLAADDPLLAGADGLAFGDKTTLYVNSVTAGKLLRLQLGSDGKSAGIVELKLPRKLNRLSAPQWPHTTVIDQTPLAGTRVGASSEVELTVAN